MKKINLLIAFVFFMMITLSAQNDTMYILRAGNIIGKFRVSEIDSIVFYTPKEKLNYISLIDSRDGNIYKTILIGSKVWMAENLRYLPSIVGPGSGSQTESNYYVYGYNGTSADDAKLTSNYNTYGVLYNWSAVMNQASSSILNPSGIRGLCPAEWHIPSDAEWAELAEFLGGQSLAGGKLKEMGITHWVSPNTGATNETGFTGLPGGYKSENGTFAGIGTTGYWWSATEDFSSNAWYWFMDSNSKYLNRFSNSKEIGYAVRCVKD